MRGIGIKVRTATAMWTAWPRPSVRPAYCSQCWMPGSSLLNAVFTVDKVEPQFGSLHNGSCQLSC